MIVVMFTIISTNLVAQVTYTQQGGTKLTVAGTSTMHNWTMVSTGGSCTAVFEVNDKGKPTRLIILSVTLPAESLKSEKSAMDKNAYTALKTDKNKTISFNLVNATITSNVIKVSGKMTIAGTTRETDVTAVFTVGADNSIQVKGFKKLVMTEYNVEPPSFMFGSVKTGDEITISFDLLLTPAKTQPLTLN
jgi:hypothetical protein